MVIDWLLLLKVLCYYLLGMAAVYIGYCYRRHNEYEQKKILREQRKLIEENEIFHTGDNW